MLLQVPHTGCLFFLAASCPSPHHHIANISHSGGEKVSSFALLENIYSLNSVLMPAKKKKKKISRAVSREAAFDYSNLEEMKGFICGNWDIRWCLLREARFFFFNHPSTPPHSKK